MYYIEKAMGIKAGCPGKIGGFFEPAVLSRSFSKAGKNHRVTNIFLLIPNSFIESRTT
jgi:hypothetical protein